MAGRREANLTPSLIHFNGCEAPVRYCGEPEPAAAGAAGAASVVSAS
jgi:hypothetical protein